jgi:hypothetical protein
MLQTGRRNQVRRWRTVWSALLPLALSSCGSGESPDVPLIRTTGQIFYLGQPATGATVILHPVQDKRVWNRGYPSGAVAADGSVIIKTGGEWVGAPAGEYAVIVVWMPTESGDQRTAEEETADKLAGKYADPANSPWKVKVEGIRCELPRIELQ